VQKARARLGVIQGRVDGVRVGEVFEVLTNVRIGTAIEAIEQGHGDTGRAKDHPLQVSAISL
jgi:hypothetical protein